MRLRRGRVAGSDRQLLCNVIPVDISDQRSVAVRRDKAGLGLTPGSPAAPRVFIHLHPAPVLRGGVSVVDAVISPQASCKDTP